MRSKPLLPLLAAAALVAMFGCQTPALTPTPASAMRTERVGDGPATATVRLTPGYRALAGETHYWMADDVHTYVVTLEKLKTAEDEEDEEGMPDLPPGLLGMPGFSGGAPFTVQDMEDEDEPEYIYIDEIALEQKVEAPASTASFTGLVPGVYRAFVAAMGSPGGESPDSQLNRETIVPLDLSAATSATGTATIAFDPIDVDFAGHVIIHPATESGALVAPSAAPTAGVDQ